MNEQKDVQNSQIGGERCEKTKEKVWRIAIWARYLTPLFTTVLLLVLSFFDLVYFYMGGRRYKMPLFDFYKNVLVATREYLGGKPTPAKNGFYGLLCAGAIVGILLFLLAAFLCGLSAYTAARAFRAGKESEQTKRMKVIFRVAFAGRIALFASNCLPLLVAAYPLYYAAVTARFLEVSGGATMYSVLCVPLIVCAALVALTGALAICIRRKETALGMNMFHVWTPSEDGAQEGEDSD